MKTISIAGLWSNGDLSNAGVSALFHPSAPFASDKVGSNSTACQAIARDRYYDPSKEVPGISNSNGLVIVQNPHGTTASPYGNNTAYTNFISTVRSGLTSNSTVLYMNFNKNKHNTYNSLYQNYKRKLAL